VANKIIIIINVYLFLNVFNIRQDKRSSLEIIRHTEARNELQFCVFQS